MSSAPARRGTQVCNPGGGAASAKKCVEMRKREGKSGDRACGERIDVAMRHSGGSRSLPEEEEGMSWSPMWQPQVEQKKRADAAAVECVYPVQAVSRVDGAMKTGWMRLGSGAWKQQKEPWVWRQIEQWQRCVRRGNAERGRVRVKWTDLQWHWPVRVRVGVIADVCRWPRCLGGTARVRRVSVGLLLVLWLESAMDGAPPGEKSDPASTCGQMATISRLSTKTLQSRFEPHARHAKPCGWAAI